MHSLVPPARTKRHPQHGTAVTAHDRKGDAGSFSPSRLSPHREHDRKRASTVTCIPRAGRAHSSLRARPRSPAMSIVSAADKRHPRAQGEGLVVALKGMQSRSACRATSSSSGPRAADRPEQLPGPVRRERGDAHRPAYQSSEALRLQPLLLLLLFLVGGVRVVLFLPDPMRQAYVSTGSHSKQTPRAAAAVTPSLLVHHLAGPAACHAGPRTEGPPSRTSLPKGSLIFMRF